MRSTAFWAVKSRLQIKETRISQAQAKDTLIHRHRRQFLQVADENAAVYDRVVAAMVTVDQQYMDRSVPKSLRAQDDGVNNICQLYGGNAAAEPMR